MREIYFSIKNPARGYDKTVGNLSFVDKLYLASIPDKKEAYLFGTSKETHKVLSKHDGRDNFNIEIESVISDFKREPNLVSILALNKYSNSSSIKEIINRKLEETPDGLCYKKSYGGYISTSTMMDKDDRGWRRSFFPTDISPDPVPKFKVTRKVRNLSSKLTKIAASYPVKPSDERYRYGHQQYLVLEFCGMHNSARKYADVMEEEVSKKVGVLSNSIFSLIGENMKQSIKPRTAKLEVG